MSNICPRKYFLCAHIKIVFSGGIRLVLSDTFGGDPRGTKDSKNTFDYAETRQRVHQVKHPTPDQVVLVQILLYNNTNLSLYNIL